MADGKDGYYQIGRCSSMVNVSLVAANSGNNSDYYGNCDYPAMIEEFAQARRNGTKVLSVTSVGGVFAAYDFIDNVDAAITTYYPGQYFAAGLAAVLSGAISPGGKLTQTLPRLEILNGSKYIQSPIGRFNAGLKVPSQYCVGGSFSDCLKGATNTLQAPAYMWDTQNNKFSDVVQYGFSTSIYSEGALVGYKYYEKYGVKPLFPFGFGLSYGSWGMSTNFKECESVTRCTVVVEATLENYPANGVVSNVVQVYLGYKPDVESISKTYPVKELNAFRKIWGTTKVAFEIDFSTAWDHVVKIWRTPCMRDGTPGIFSISVGYSSADIFASKEMPCDRDPQ